MVLYDRSLCFCYCCCLNKKDFIRINKHKLSSNLKEKRVFIVWKGIKMWRVLCFGKYKIFLLCPIFFIYSASLPSDIFPFKLAPVVIVYLSWTSWSKLILGATLWVSFKLQQRWHYPSVPFFVFTLIKKSLWPKCNIKKNSAPQKIFHRKWDLTDQL